MKTKSTFLSSALAVTLLLVTSTESSATLNYTIQFTASGVTTSVGSVRVQNLNKGTTATVPSGNNLLLTDQATDIQALSASDTGIRILQNANTGTYTMTFYASQGGSAQVAAYAPDGRKVAGQTTWMEAGDNSFELSLPTGMFLLRISGVGYAYSAKLQSQSFTNQVNINYLSNKKVEASGPMKSKGAATATTIMSYTDGDHLLYTATSGTYIASVTDVPTGSKTTNFVFYSIPTSSIPGGTFIMGSPATEVNRNDDETQHTVTLSAFRISKYEITNAQYAAFLNAKSIWKDGIYAAGVYPTQTLIYAGSGNSDDLGLHYSNSLWLPVAGNENNPVINVTWYGAMEFATYVSGTLPLM